MEFNPQGTSTPITEVQTESVDIQTDSFDMPSPIQEETEVPGLAQEELRDPNQIAITISDNRTPIVVLFGPPACGKTMTLVRLTRYLKMNGYKVVPDGTFRPAADTNYQNMCRKFNDMINSDNAAEQTSHISFMLVKIIDENGRTMCQILEAPGELYFDPKRPNQPFPRYVNAIKNGNNRKIWCYMVEPDWLDASDRLAYVERIKTLKKNMRPTDKAIFVFNKIDKTEFVLPSGRINVKMARRAVEDLYPGIFVNFRSKGVFFGMNDNFSFVPFQTGDYSKTQAGGFTFEPGSDEYPKQLWKAIMKYVKG